MKEFEGGRKGMMKKKEEKNEGEEFKMADG